MIVSAQTSPSLAPVVTLFAREAMAPRAGSLALLSRLSEILFIELLRLEGERSGCKKGDLKALTDPRLARALALIHESFADDWTIESLGRAVGLSRSAFAARFTSMVGEPPQQYLLRWRMTRAAELLAAGAASVGEIAAQVGYDSEASFHRAFRRVLGEPPGAYRRRRRAVT
jgi:AraC-like DNA-binding protein